jgi:hypothetical protein
LRSGLVVLRPALRHARFSSSVSTFADVSDVYRPRNQSYPLERCTLRHLEA